MTVFRVPLGRRSSLAMLMLLLVLHTTTTDAYSKYGRTCKDIGCLSNEVCTMAHESCSYTQREGKDCGAFPTCTRNPNGGAISPGASLAQTPDNTVLSGNSHHHPAPLNTPSQPRDHHLNAGGHNVYNLPGPPIDPNSIFGSPMGQPQAPAWNSPPAFPNQNTRGGGGGMGNGGGSGQSNAVYPHIYPQIPQSQPMPQYPYAVPPPYNPPSQQQPYAFGNPPPPRNYPTYYVTTTREPSLWNQFLYNKQGGKKPSSGAESRMAAATAPLTVLMLALGWWGASIAGRWCFM